MPPKKASSTSSDPAAPPRRSTRNIKPTAAIEAPEIAPRPQPQPTIEKPATRKPAVKTNPPAAAIKTSKALKGKRLAAAEVIASPSDEGVNAEGEVVPATSEAISKPMDGLDDEENLGGGTESDWIDDYNEFKGIGELIHTQSPM